MTIFRHLDRKAIAGFTALACAGALIIYKADAAKFPALAYIDRTFVLPSLVFFLFLALGGVPLRRLLDAVFVAALALIIMAAGQDLLLTLLPLDLAQAWVSSAIGGAVVALALWMSQLLIVGPTSKMGVRLASGVAVVAMTLYLIKLESHPSLDPLPHATHVLIGALAYALLLGPTGRLALRFLPSPRVREA